MTEMIAMYEFTQTRSVAEVRRLIVVLNSWKSRKLCPTDTATEAAIFFKKTRGKTRVTHAQSKILPGSP